MVTILQLQCAGPGTRSVYRGGDKADGSAPFVRIRVHETNTTRSTSKEQERWNVESRTDGDQPMISPCRLFVGARSLSGSLDCFGLLICCETVGGTVECVNSLCWLSPGFSRRPSVSLYRNTHTKRVLALFILLTTDVVQASRLTRWMINTHIQLSSVATVSVFIPEIMAYGSISVFSRSTIGVFSLVSRLSGSVLVNELRALTTRLFIGQMFCAAEPPMLVSPHSKLITSLRNTHVFCLYPPSLSLTLYPVSLSLAAGAAPAALTATRQAD